MVYLFKNFEQHNLVFAAWLVQIFGQQKLRCNGVTDIAGGNGLLSYELTVRYGIFCTVIDPRTIRLNAIRRRNIRKITKKRLATTSINDNEIFESPSQNKAQLTDKYVMVLLRNMGITNQDDGHILPSVQLAIENRELLPFAHICCEFGADFELGTTSLVVGMHPDMVRNLFNESPCFNFAAGNNDLLVVCFKATESIVDVALRLGISFAVVPCCVFANKFPNRRTRRGELVKTYEEFISYLQEKDISIQQATLPFMGRNIVLYRVVGAI